ncbi:MAG: Rne/Rng family ribonuclease [Cyanobacteria bacterium SZAS LIN-3]|nr:Rne/Rng family ribonuclease [Cyanobacteria bacterium SZAS LIN-3]
MRKSLVISEVDNIAALLENDRVVEFFVNRGELLLGDIYTASVENILPGIDAAFVNLGKDKMGFLHANDVPGQGPLKERLVPKQKLLVQITKEPTGHKGPRVSTAISLPGRFLVLVPEERGVSISRRISEARERARLKSVVNLMKPPGVGIIIRTEAKGQGDQELYEDFEQLWDRWQTIVSEAEASIGPTLIYRDQDLLFRVIRDAFSHDVTEIIADTPEGQRRAQEYLSGWAGKTTKVIFHSSEEPLLLSKGIDKEIEAALSDRAELPSGGHLNIQPTEALTVIDVNSGRFTSSRTQAETVRRTNLEAAQEIPRQLRLRNIGGMVIVDFIDMDSRKDQQQVLEAFQRALEDDRAKPQIGQLSDLGLVELTRRRQGQSLRELFSVKCGHCVGQGVIPTLELGPPEDRRVISFKSKEEDMLGRKGRGRGGRGGNNSHSLKSASVGGGRIVPTMLDQGSEADHAGHGHDSHGRHGRDRADLHTEAHDHELDDVPEEILAMMPEDMLDSRVAGKPPLKHNRFDDGDEEGGDDEEVIIDVKATPVGGQKNLFVEGLSDEDDGEYTEDLAMDLARSVSAVESVYQEMDMHDSNREANHEHGYEHQEGDQTETIHVIEVDYPGVYADVPVVTDGMDHDGEHEGHSHEAEGAEEEVQHIDVEVPSESDGDDDHEPEVEVESAIAAEIDPVTGIYRLKPKASSEDNGHFEGGADDTAGEQLNHEQGQQHGGEFSQMLIPSLVSEAASGGSEEHRENGEFSEYSSQQDDQ